MPKTASFTTITPLPAGIARKSVLEMYQDHLAMIDLNPLVVERFKCKAPSYAPTDEYYLTWYTIKDKVSYLPGGLAQGSVSYHACFHDLPDGLQTHVYAPLGLDIRGKWSVGGSLPGEPKQPTEKGLKVPGYGLYIREDVKMTCSSLLLGFVKRTFKDSHASLVEKLVERAHILESNFANQRLQALRNVDPGERMATGDIFIAPPPDYLLTGSSSPMYQTTPQAISSPLGQPSSPLLSPLNRIQTQPSPRLVPPPHFAHSRSYSEPINSPGFSQASTLLSKKDQFTKAPGPSNNSLSTTIEFPYVEEPIATSSSAPERTSRYLLPATTYNGPSSSPPKLRPTTSPDGDFSSRHNDGPLSLYPGGPRTYHAWEALDVLGDDSPRISYVPEGPPTSITFAFSDDLSESAKDAHELLNKIESAIDQAFTTYVAPAAEQRSGLAGMALRPEVQDELLNPRGDVGARHKRKDSVVPSLPWTEKELPPVPLNAT